MQIFKHITNSNGKLSFINLHFSALFSFALQDLVKSHLMIAVREEVEVLKERISELMDKISNLELENNILKSNMSPETLQQLQIQLQIAGSQQPAAVAAPPATPAIQAAPTVVAAAPASAAATSPATAVAPAAVTVIANGGGGSTNGSSSTENGSNSAGVVVVDAAVTAQSVSDAVQSAAAAAAANGSSSGNVVGVATAAVSTNGPMS